MIARLEQWLRWPLWSWRNLTISTIAVLALFTAVGHLTAGSGSGPDSRPRNVAATATPTSPSATTTAPATTPASAMSPAAPASATPATSALAARSGPGTTPIGSPSSTATAGAETPTRVALDFTTAWTRTTLAQPAWLAALKPLVIPEYLAALSTVDPARVPATRTRDTGRLLSTSGQQSLVQVATNAGGMTVTLVLRTCSLGDRDPHCRWGRPGSPGPRTPMEHTAGVPEPSVAHRKFMG